MPQSPQAVIVTIGEEILRGEISDTNTAWIGRRLSALGFRVGAGMTVADRTEDIVEALKSGKLAGFATDVWFSDPPENSPLMDAPNTIFTPHIGASSKENMKRIGVIIERLVSEFAAKK